MKALNTYRKREGIQNSHATDYLYGLNKGLELGWRAALEWVLKQPTWGIDECSLMEDIKQELSEG